MHATNSLKASLSARMGGGGGGGGGQIITHRHVLNVSWLKLD